MSDQNQTLQHDLEYLKALAKDGRDAPLLGGLTLVFAGVAFGSASIAAYLLQTDRITADPSWRSLVWLIAMGVFFVGLFCTRGRVIRQPGAMAPSNRAVGGAWQAVGWSILAMGLSLAAMGWRHHSFAPGLFFAPYIMAVYGIGWAVAATMSRKMWIGLVAIGCFVATVIMGALAGDAEQYLAYAAALILLAAVPGAVLLRGEPSHTI